jgi:hypothetical protein
MNRLRELAEKSGSAKELVEAMKAEKLDHVKNAMLEWMREEGESAARGGLIGDPGVEISYTDEGVRLNKDVLDNAGFVRGQKLQLAVENGKVTLRKG